jgi:hypothetical protein
MHLRTPLDRQSMTHTITNIARRLALAPALFASVAGAQAFAPGREPARTADLVASRPFKPGELLTYDVRFGSLKVGTGSMEVKAIETVRGRQAYHTMFRVQGGIPLFRVDDRFESWFAVDDLSSLRFYKDQEEGTREKSLRYDIFPERAAFDDVTDSDPEQRSVSNPLDDGSFLYFVRTVPLAVGQTYTFDRYFKPDRNPVTIRVLRKEKVTVPAGTFDAIVVPPMINTKGIFSEDGHAEVWLSDDSRRVMLQMKSQLKFGSLNLYLTSAKPGA